MEENRKRTPVRPLFLRAFTLSFSRSYRDLRAWTEKLGYPEPNNSHKDFSGLVGMQLLFERWFTLATEATEA